MDPTTEQPRPFREPKENKILRIEYGLLLSKEYRSLSPAARDVYHLFLYKRRFSKSKHGKPGRLINNCALQFTENEAVEKWGIPKNSFWRSIKSLKDKKMIRLAHKGHGIHHDVSLYELIGKFDGVCKFK